MFWKSQLSFLLQHFRSPARVAKRQHADDFVQLSLDRLEERRVLSVTSAAILTGDILEIMADGANDDISITLQNAGLPNETLEITDNTALMPTSWQFNTSDINQIVINLGDGNDTLTFQVPSGLASNFGSVSVMIDGGMGDDGVTVMDNGNGVAATQTTVTVVSETIQFMSTAMLPNPVTFGDVDFDLTGNVGISSDLTLVTSGHFNLTGDVVTMTSNQFDLSADGIEFNGSIGDVLPGTSIGDLTLNAGMSDLGIQNIHSNGSVSLNGTNINVDGSTANTLIETADLTIHGTLHLNEHTSLQTSTGNIDLTNASLIADVVNLDLTLNSANDIFLSEINTAAGAMDTLDLSIDAVGMTTFNGNADNVGVLDVNSGEVLIHATSITTSGNQTYTDTVSLGSNVALAGAALEFGSLADSGAHSLALSGPATVNGTLNIGGNLSTDNTLATTNSGDLIIGGDLTAPLGVTAAGMISVTGTSSLGGTVQSSGSQSFTGATTLTSNTFLISTSGAAINLGEVNGGALNLTVTTAGTTTFSGTVTNIAQLAVTGAGPSHIDTALLSATEMDFAGSVEIQQSTTFTAITSLNFQSDINSQAGEFNTLTINASAASVMVGGDIGNQSSLGEVNIIVGTGTISLNDVTTDDEMMHSGDQTYAATTITTNSTYNTGGGDFTMLGDWVVNSTSDVNTMGGNILLAQAVVSAGAANVDLALVAGTGNVELGTFENVAGGHFIEDLTVSGENVSTANSLPIETSSSVDITGTTLVAVASTITSGASGISLTGPTLLGGDLITSAGAITVDGAVLVDGIRSVTSNGGNITFEHSVDGKNMGGTDTLEILAGAGAAELNGDVGSNPEDLEGLTINAATVSLLNVNIAGPIDVSGITTLKGSSYSTSNGAITFQNETMVTMTTTFDSSDSVSFSGTLQGSGPQDVIINAVSTVDLFDAVSGLKDLSINTAGTSTFSSTLNIGGHLLTNGGGSTVLNDSITTGGSQTYNDSVILAGDLILDGGDIRFDSTLNSQSMTHYSLNITSSGAATFNGAVGTVDALSALTVSAVSIAIDGGAISTTGRQSFSGPATLGANTVLTSHFSAGIEFTSTLMGNMNSLDIVGGAEFQDAVSGISKFNADTIVTEATLSAASINVSGSSELGGNLTATSGAIALGNNVTLTDHVTLTAATTIMVTGNVTGDGVMNRNVSFDATHTIIDGLIGTQINDLTVLNGILDANAIQIMGNLMAQSDVTTTGNLSANTISVSGDLIVGDALHAIGTVDVGGMLMVTGASLLCDDVTANGEIVFSGPVELTADVTITSMSSNVTFNSTVNSDSTGTYELTVDALLGSVTFVGEVGTQPDGILGSLSINASDIQLQNNTNVDGAVSLTGTTIQVDQTVTTTNGGSVTIDNSGLLTLSNSASFNLDGVFNQTGTGSVSTGADITTTGDAVMFAKAVSLSESITINTTNDSATGASVAFSMSLDGTTAGTEDLTINAGSAGNVLFDGAVGQTNQLREITVTNAANFSLNATLTANSLQQISGSGTTTLDGLVTVNSAPGLQLTTNHVIVNAAINAQTNAQINLTATADLIINSQIDSDTGIVTLTATDLLEFTSTSDITSTSGAISLMGHTITMADETLIDAGTDTITFDAIQDVTLGSVTTTNATSLAIQITSVSGAIIDAGNMGVGLQAEHGQLNLQAATGIGSGNELEISVKSVSAVVQTSGDIRLTETNAVDVIRLENNGAGNVTLQTLDGNINLLGAITSLGHTTLNASEMILDGNDGSTLISTNDLSLIAKTNIGSITDLSAKTGNSIDVAVSGELKDLSTSASGEINLSATGNLVAATAAIQPGMNASANLLIQATGNLDLGTNANTIILSESDNVALCGGEQLILTNATLDVGSTGTIRLTGTQGIQAPTNKIVSQDLIISTEETGALVFVTNVETLTINANSAASLTINECDSITITEVTTTNQDVTINAALESDGDITIQQINAGTGNVMLNTVTGGNTGGILDGDETLTDIIAGDLLLETSTGVADGDQLEVEIASLSATTASGDINILNDTSALVINKLLISGGTASDHILVNSNGSMNVNGEVSNSGAGNIMLTADGTGSDLTISAAVLSGTGDVSLTATDDVIFTATGDVTSTSGTAHVSGTSISMNDQTLIDAGIGTITFDAFQDISLGGLVTTSNSAQAIILTSTTGAITDAGDTHIDISAVNGQVNLAASTGIGSGNELEIQTQRVSAMNVTSGNIELVAVTGDLEVVKLVNLGGGNVDLETTNGKLTTTGPVSTTANGTIDLTANNGLLVIDSEITSEDGGVTLISSTNDISFTANGMLSTNSGWVDLQATTGTISQASGSVINAGDATINMQANGDITLASVITTNNTDNAVTLTTTSGAVNSIDLGVLNIDAVNGRLVIDAETGVGPINTNVDSLDVLLASGSVIISEADAVEVVRITDKGAGPLSLVDLSAGGTITLVDSQPGIDATTVKLTATGADSDIEVNSQITASDVELVADDEISFGANSSVNASVSAELQAGDTISFAAHSTLTTPMFNANSAGAIEMTDTSILNATGGSATLTAVNDVQVSQIIATDMIAIVSTSAGITDAGNSGGADLIAESLQLAASTGIGSSNPLETEVRILETVNTTSGSTRIANNGDAPLQLNGISNGGSGNGEIIISNTGTINIDAPVTNLSGGQLKLVATDSPNSAGTINVNSGGPLRAEGANADIVLTAETDLTINDTGETNDLVGKSVTGSAGNKVTIAPMGVIVKSSTGSVTKTTPDLDNVVTPQVLSTGIAVIEGDFGDTENNNFIFNIVWDVDGPVQDTYASGDPIFNHASQTTMGITPGVGPGSFSFDHRYFGNPDELNPANDIPISITLFDDPNITFLENGEDLGQTSVTSFADVPGDGLAGGIAFDLSIEVPQIAAPRVEFSGSNDLTSNDFSETSESAEVQAIVETEAVQDDRMIFIEKIDRNGNVEIDSNGKPVQQTLYGDEAQAVLDDLPGLFKTLDEGHWRIYLKEGGDAQQQLVRDVVLREGVPASQDAGTQDRPPTEEANVAPLKNAEAMENLKQLNPDADETDTNSKIDRPSPPQLPEKIYQNSTLITPASKTTFVLASIAFVPLSRTSALIVLAKIRTSFKHFIDR